MDINAFLSQLIEPFTSGYFITMLKATTITLEVAFGSLIVGLILAMLFAVLEMNRFKFIQWPISIIVTVIRSLPEMVFVFIIGMGLPYILSIMLEDPPEISYLALGIIALSLIYASYASQTLRGAFLSVPKSQWESGSALGLAKTTIFFKIIMPQMWRHAMPGLGNQWLVLLKDTALVSLIGLTDLMHAANSAATATQKTFTWLGIAALIYLCITILSQRLQFYFQRFLTRYER